ncbi:MAG TPA: histidine kinase [Micromonosporaceae bacterium]|nr:histidine kinase [Micromonosporaceae bacterium]
MAGVLVVAVGGAEVYTSNLYGGHSAPTMTAVVLATAVAVGFSRHAPGAVLVLVWAVVGVQLAADVPVVLTQLAIAVVAFGTARWGSTATVWGSALSIPIGAAVAVKFLATSILSALSGYADYGLLLSAFSRFSDNWRIGAIVVSMSLLGVPWLAGLVLRVSARAREQAILASADIARVEAGREQAREIARVREEQARLARDVHDVVGHSLAVILAQAESAQYLPAEDPAAFKVTLANIATSARASLRDIRQVLSATKDSGRPGTDDVDVLIEGLRTSGYEVISTRLGTASPLPPELAVTVFRVLQEMLTNAMKHGRRNGAVIVQRQWPDGSGEENLKIEVRNAVDAGRADAVATGRGLTGMRERLESVGGQLDVRQRDDVFTATAWVPIRT